MVRAGLRGEPVGVLSDAFAIERSLPAGHVHAALVMARRLELARLLDRQPSRERDLVSGDDLPAGDRAGVEARDASRAFGQSTLAEELGVADADEDDLYAAMDWLLERQAADRGSPRAPAPGRTGSSCSTTCPPRISRGAAASWRSWGTRVIGKRGSPQIIYGLLCDKPGRPIGVEVFSGELHDDKTLPSQIEKLKTRFGLSQGGRRLRPRDGHQGQPRADARGRRDRLDHRAQGAADPEARPPGRAAAVAV